MTSANTKAMSKTNKNSLINLDIPANSSLEEVAEMVVTRAKERFKNRYLMLHGDDESEDGSGRRVLQSWHLFSTKTKKNALTPIAEEIADFILNWDATTGEGVC